MPSLPDGCTLIELQSVGSTNDEARDRAQSGAPDGTVIWAREQTAGRGRRGRGWSSPVGNLYTSTILRPNRPAGEAAQLSLVAAVALAQALDTVLPSEAEVACKWPNDILVDSKKIAGILLESQGNGDAVRWIVIGCGVNIASHPETTAYPATDVNAVCGESAATETVLEHYLKQLFEWRDRWRADGNRAGAARLDRPGCGVGRGRSRCGCPTASCPDGFSTWMRTARCCWNCPTASDSVLPQATSL